MSGIVTGAKNRYVGIKELDEHLKKEHGIERYKCFECGK